MAAAHGRGHGDALGPFAFRIRAVRCGARRRAYDPGVLFDALFLFLFFAAWCVLGVLAWIPLSLRRGSVGALFALPFALAGGAGGGAAVPLLGLDTGAGVGASMAAALAGGALLCAAAYRVWDGLDLGARFAGWARRAGGGQAVQSRQAERGRERER